LIYGHVLHGTPAFIQHSANGLSPLRMAGLGLSDKNLVKNRKINFPRQAIQEPIFSVANADFVGDGVGRGCGNFLAR
jgi:hypothetical protein